MFNNIVVIGSSGAIGDAFVKEIASNYINAQIHAVSSKYEYAQQHANISYHPINYADEQSIAALALQIGTQQQVDMLIIAVGMLHNTNITPEKSLKNLSAHNLAYLYAANAIVPAMLIKHFQPQLIKSTQGIIAVLSARVGSISDNKLGGWYSYRAAKAALNMIIKNVAIELNRTHKHMVVIGLHPGSVASYLSEPFKHNIKPHKLFTPEYAVKQLMQVMHTVQLKDSGKCFAWDGKVIEP